MEVLDTSRGAFAISFFSGEKLPRISPLVARPEIVGDEVEEKIDLPVPQLPGRAGQGVGKA
jgi:hypothetical protein